MLKVAIILVAVCVAINGLPQKLGGWTDQAAITDEIMNIAKWSASQLSGYTGIQGDHNVMTVRNVQTQIVDGVNYKFTLELLVASTENKYYFRTCDLQVYDQAWTNTRTLTSAQCRKTYPLVDDFPSYKAMPVMTVGGWTDQTAITDEIMDIARWSSSQLSGYTGIQGDHNVMTVKNVQTQVVSGVNYKFTLELLVASADNKYYFRTCDLLVNDQAWTNTRTLLSAQCRKTYPLVEDFPSFKAMPEVITGGWTDQTAITDEIMNIAKWSASQLSGYTGIQGDHNVMTVKNVQTQVVSGVNYKFTLELLVASADNKYYFRTCDLLVNDQAWTNTRTLLSAQCRKTYPLVEDFPQ